MGAQALYNPATHVSICVDGVTLVTNPVDKDVNPIFNETLTWWSYTPQKSKHAIVKVWCRG